MTAKEMAERLRESATEATSMSKNHNLDARFLGFDILKNQAQIMEALAMLLDGENKSVTTW